MREQNVLVYRATHNLNILSDTIAKNFSKGHYVCRAFVWSVNTMQNEYMVKLFHSNPNEEEVKDKIFDALSPYCNKDSEIFFISRTSLI